MKIGVSVCGIVIFIVGILIIIAPKVIQKLNEIGNKVIFNDDKTLKHRYIFGIIFIFIGGLMVYLSVR